MSLASSADGTAPNLAKSSEDGAAPSAGRDDAVGFGELARIYGSKLGAWYTADTAQLNDDDSVRHLPDLSIHAREYPEFDVEGWSAASEPYSNNFERTDVMPESAHANYAGRLVGDVFASRFPRYGDLLDLGLFGNTAGGVRYADGPNGMPRIRFTSGGGCMTTPIVPGLVGGTFLQAFMVAKLAAPAPAGVFDFFALYNASVVMQLVDVNHPSSGLKGHGWGGSSALITDAAETDTSDYFLWSITQSLGSPVELRKNETLIAQSATNVLGPTPVADPVYSAHALFLPDRTGSASRATVDFVELFFLTAPETASERTRRIAHLNRRYGWELT